MFVLYYRSYFFLWPLWIKLFLFHCKFVIYSEWLMILYIDAFTNMKCIHHVKILNFDLMLQCCIQTQPRCGSTIFFSKERLGLWTFVNIKIKQIYIYKWCYCFLFFSSIFALFHFFPIFWNPKEGAGVKPHNLRLDPPIRLA